MYLRSRQLHGLVSAVILSVLGLAGLARSQGHLESLQRERARDMLKLIADGIRKHYYDPKFHGVDIDAKVRAADEKIKSADLLAQAFTAIAAAVASLDDSHTRFLPPDRPTKLDYGFRMEMVGDECFITQVRPNTDAATKLKIGDQILTAEGFRTERRSLGDMMYFFNRLAPRAVLHLLLRGTDGSERQAEVQAKMREGKRVADLTGAGGGTDIWNLIREEENEEHLVRQRYFEEGEALMI